MHWRSNRPGGPANGMGAAQASMWLLLALLAGCDDDLLAPERFAYANPAQRQAGESDGDVADAGSPTDGLSADGAGSDAGLGDTEPDGLSRGSDGAMGDAQDVAESLPCVNDLDCAALDDGDRCNGIWSCHTSQGKGVCAPKASSSVTCPTQADTACAAAQCDPGTGGCSLQSMPNGTACDDGESCTDGDACKDGACAPGPILACACTEDSDCAALEDGDPCNGTLYCVTNGGKAACLVDPATVVTCDASKDATCVSNECLKATGLCALVAVNEGGACKADGNQCAGSLVCGGGHCLAAEPGDCDDGNPCTLNACDPAKGCVFKSKAVDGKACDTDGKPCATADTCKGGSCHSGPPKDCDDGDPCTNDACDTDTGACTHNKTC